MFFRDLRLQKEDRKQAQIDRELNRDVVKLQMKTAKDELARQKRVRALIAQRGF
jgi:hypothetical protein